MRLLNSLTLQFEEFLDDELPVYVILSHTWGPEEVLFQDMQKSQVSNKAGFSKIQGFCAKAARDGYKWVWIDTCCIDKTSSAELSEAINSMYNWYKGARICYAYLSDIPARSSVWHPVLGGPFDGQNFFRSSRWFSRGWTLQELIAPSIVEFYASDWTEIGTKSELRQELSDITSISIRVLTGDDPSTCNVAERMSWAAFRETTRVEDMAYCLLGIFHVNMPLLYGEGKRSFIRLQEEIIKESEDYTLFAWPIRGSVSSIDKSEGTTARRGLLAESITEFCVGTGLDQKYSDLKLLDPSQLRIRSRNSVHNASTILDAPPVLTSRGLRIHIPLLKNPSDGTYSAFLYCKMRPEKSLVCISLVKLGSGHHSLMKKVFSGNAGFHMIPAEKLRDFKAKTVYVRQGDQGEDYQLLKKKIRSYAAEFYLDTQALKESKLSIDYDYIFPASEKHKSMTDMYIHPGWNQSGLVLLDRGTTDSFIVRFGLQSYGPWCEIILEAECLHKRGTIMGWMSFASLGQGSTDYIEEEGPSDLDTSDSSTDSSTDLENRLVKVDRANKRLRSGLASVNVAVRRLRHHCTLQISIC